MNELMNETITIARPTTANKFAEFSSIAMYVNVRLEMIEKRFKNAEGETMISQGTLYSATRLLKGDTLTYEGINYKVEKVETIKDLVGAIQHYQALLV
jgi:hypothetical protein